MTEIDVPAKSRFIALTRWEWLCLAVGIAITHGFYVHLLAYPGQGDTTGYTQAAFEIVRDGLQTHWFMARLRTYGYPFFLSNLNRFHNNTQIPITLVIVEAQLLLYVGAAFLLRAALTPLTPRAGQIAFCGVMFNYYCLLYVPITLTESLSVTLVIVAAACWLMLQQNRSAIWPLILGSLSAGYAVMVRPANLFLMATWALGCLMIFKWERKGAAASAARVVAMLVLIALPFVPQLLNNMRLFDRATPLVVADLGVQQLRWGISFSKYATGVAPFVAQPEIFYHNPFAQGAVVDADAPARWYFENPVAGAATIALHIFNMTDQDLLFTYSRDLHPWYRLPLGLINHAAVGLGLLGLALLWREAVRTRARPAFERAIAVSLLLGSCCAVYGATAVEMRFGLPLLLVLFPLAGFTIYALKGRAAKTKIQVLGAAATYMIAAMLLSEWVRGYAPQISPG